jgi:hypothetical protein
VNDRPTRRTDPEYISAMEHFESMPHEEIYAQAQRIDAGEILRASLVWLDAATAVTTSMPITRATADDVMSSAGWEGPAADAAYASTRRFAASVDELAEVMAEVGARLGAVAAAAEAVKLAVVPPGNSGPIGAVVRLLEASHVIDAQLAREAMRQEAVLAMNMIYKPAYSAAGTGIPALPEPPDLPGTPPAHHAPSNHTPANPPAPQPPPPPQQAPATPQQPQPPQTSTPAPAPAQTPPPPTPTQPPNTPAPSPAPNLPAGPPLSDQGGQPGITGPIPGNSTTPTTDQPGVSPDH